MAGFVAIAAQVNSRVAPSYRILVSAAGSDADAAALLDELTRRPRGTGCWFSTGAGRPNGTSGG